MNPAHPSRRLVGRRWHSSASCVFPASRPSRACGTGRGGTALRAVSGVSPVGVAALLCVNVGCSYSHVPVRIEARERGTLAPIVGATVHISNTSLLNPWSPKPAEGVTDDAGSVVLAVAVYNNLKILICAPGVPEHVFSSEHPAVIGATEWRAPSFVHDGASPKIEIRLTPSDLPPEQPVEGTGVPPVKPELRP